MFKVMIVDDEWLVREGLKVTIPWAEMQCKVVAEAENGQDALLLFEELQPDIVISDIRMPGMDGFTFVKEINERFPEVTTIFLTGFDDFNYAQQAMKLGAFEILLKPSDPEELQRVVGEATRKITIQRQQDDYKKSLENRQRTSQPFVLENVLHHLLLDTVTIQEMQLLLEALQGRLELFDDYRAAILDYSCTGAEFDKKAQTCKVDQSPMGKFLMRYALTDAIALNEHSFAILLNESGGSKWRAGMKELQDRHLDAEVKVSMSRVHHGLLTLGEAYAEASLAHFHHALMNYPQVIEYETVSNDALSYTEWNEVDIVEAMKWGTAEELKQTLQALYKAVVWRSGGRDMKQRQIGTQLLFVVYNLLNRHFSETGGLPELKQVVEEIDKRQSYELLLEWLESMVSEVQNRYVRSKAHMKNEIDEVIDYVNAHFTEELRMYDLAMSLHMSESKFSKLFKKQTGTSFQDYVTELRINKAKELLLDPDLRIGEIAHLVGYQETRYFSQLFKRTTGQTQKSFRKKLQKLPGH